MKYLKRFNHQLMRFRESRKLSTADIAKLCSVDSSVVDAWEVTSESHRCYPTVDNLFDLCFKTGAQLELFIENPDKGETEQLELPGLAFTEESDLNSSLDKLGKELERLIPTETEQELLRRFRNSDAQNQELILQLINN